MMPSSFRQQDIKDRYVLADDIQMADEIYLWFVKLKEERDGTDR